MKGYYYDKAKDRYHVRVHRDNKNRHVGRFKTAAQALAERKRFIENYESQPETQAQDSLSRILNSSRYHQPHVKARV